MEFTRLVRAGVPLDAVRLKELRRCMEVVVEEMTKVKNLGAPAAAEEAYAPDHTLPTGPAQQGAVEGLASLLVSSASPPVRPAMVPPSGGGRGFATVATRGGIHSRVSMSRLVCSACIRGCLDCIGQQNWLVERHTASSESCSLHIS